MCTNTLSCLINFIQCQFTSILYMYMLLMYVCMYMYMYMCADFVLYAYAKSCPLSALPYKYLGAHIPLWPPSFRHPCTCTCSSVTEMCFYLLQAFCEPGNVAENGVLAFVKHVIFPILDRKGLFHYKLHVRMYHSLTKKW